MKTTLIEAVMAHLAAKEMGRQILPYTLALAVVKVKQATQAEMDCYAAEEQKLVEQYAEFDEISSPGEDILDAKKEIEKTLDMINQAFVTLLNNLFRDAAFDASADAQVLQTMLAREGLTESDFVREKSV